MRKYSAINPFKSVLTHALISFSIVGSLIQPALADSYLNDFVDSIQSVEQVKEELRNLFQERDRCQVGGCWNNISTSICETVAALDVQVNGQIVGGMTSVGSSGNIPISEADLELMKLIFSQCKPTNYQYWNWETMLHVVYSPAAEVDQQIRQRLGIDAP